MEKKQEKKLAEAIADLAKLVRQLRSQRYLQMIDNPKKFLFYNFLSGLAKGVGSIFGATVVVGGLIWLLAKLQIFSNWFAAFAEYFQEIKRF